MNTFNMIMNGETKIEELSVTELFICYTGTKQYLEQELKMRNDSIKMLHDFATKKGIVKTEGDFKDDSGYVFGKALSDEYEGYHHITNNENMNFYIPSTENISKYVKHNELIGKYLSIINECAERINSGGYMQKFFDESEPFSL